MPISYFTHCVKIIVIILFWFSIHSQISNFFLNETHNDNSANKLNTTTTAIANNLTNGCLAASDNEYLYFSSFYDNDPLYKLKIGEDEPQLMLGNEHIDMDPPGNYGVNSIVSYNDYLYFNLAYYLELSTLCRINKSNNEVEQIDNTLIYSIIGLKDGYLYFSKLAHDNKYINIYRCNLNENELKTELFIDEKISEALLVDEGILVIEPIGNIVTSKHALYLISYDRSSKRLINSKINFLTVDSMVSEGEHLVFNQTYNTYLVNKNIDNSDPELIIPSALNSCKVNIFDGYVFFFNKTDNDKVYRYNINNNIIEKFCDEPGLNSMEISIENGRVYYVSKSFIQLGEDKYDIHRPLVEAELNGSEHRLIYTSKKVYL